MRDLSTEHRAPSDQFENHPQASARMSGCHRGEWLYFAIVPGKKGLSESAECQIAWSGFRPWIVPGMTARDEGTEWHQSIERH